MVQFYCILCSVFNAIPVLVLEDLNSDLTRHHISETLVVADLTGVDDYVRGVGSLPKSIRNLFLMTSMKIGRLSSIKRHL